MSIRTAKDAREYAEENAVRAILDAMNSAVIKGLYGITTQMTEDQARILIDAGYDCEQISKSKWEITW